MTKLGKCSYSKERFIEVVKESKSIHDCVIKLGLGLGSTNRYTIKHYIKILNLDISHFTNKVDHSLKINNYKKISINELCGENTNVTTSHLKKKLIQEGIFENKCYCCDLKEWMNKPISCQLHHINGIRTDNRISNLTILCPNCHSQTDTYSGKRIKVFNKCKHCGNNCKRTYCNRECAGKDHGKLIYGKNRKVYRPNLDILLLDLKSLGCERAAKKYGVCGATYKNWIRVERNHSKEPTGNLTL